MRPTLNELQTAQDAADDAAYRRDPNAPALRAEAGRLRCIDAASNWMYRNLAATSEDIDEMAARMAIGYGVDIDVPRDAMRRVLYDAALMN